MIFKIIWFLWIALMPCWACVIGYFVLKIKEVFNGQE